MPGYALVIAIYPITPTSETDFAAHYLDGLTVSAYQVDFEYPNTVASAEPPGNLIGTAAYTADPATTAIYQLSETVVNPAPPPPTITVSLAAAAAVIDIPAEIASQFVDPAGDPYTTAANPLINVVLSVARNGSKIADDSINYDVDVWANPGPPPQSLDGIPVGLYLGLTEAGTELTNVPYLPLPQDGSPPSYSALDSVIKEIVKADPGSGSGSYDPANLTAADCLHLAREIVSNRTANPLPAPAPDLGTIYTGSAGDSHDQARQEFSAALQAYYASLNAQATRLAQYIAAWSVAQNCAAASSSATSAGLTFPVRLTSVPGPGQAAQATVILHN